MEENKRDIRPADPPPRPAGGQRPLERLEAVSEDVLAGGGQVEPEMERS